MKFNQFGMTNFIVNEVEGLHNFFTTILLTVISTRRNKKIYYRFLLKCNITIKNGHDTNFHILHPTNNEICHAKLIEVILQTSPEIYILLSKIFNFQIFAGKYHGQRVATSML